MNEARRLFSYWAHQKQKRLDNSERVCYNIPNLTERKVNGMFKYYDFTHYTAEYTRNTTAVCLSDKSDA